MKRILLIVYLLAIIAAAAISIYFLPRFFVWREIEIRNRQNSVSLDFSLATDDKEGKTEKIFLPFFEEKKELLFSQGKDFIEINLWEMKVRVYKGGLLAKEAPILLRGDDANWGGTAAGIYSVLTGYKNAYSVISEVYMPWSLRFYGKYYLHGKPYYPDGRPLDSPYSGGCLHLSNDDAQAIYELAEKGMPVLVIDKPQDGFRYPEKEESQFPEISAKSYLVADLDSGFVFKQKEAETILPLASLTKLMTAIVVAENIDLTKSITIGEKMLEAYGFTEGLEVGKSFRVVELFYPLLIESSNDSAEVLSYFLGRERTIKMMNEKAKAILMEKTNFVCPSGYAPENVSSAKDLFYLARYILNNRPVLFEITKGKMVRTFGEMSFDVTKLWNKNVFVNDPTFIGGKTGFILASRYNGLFVFRLTTKEGTERRLAIIILGSENEELDTQKIYRWLLDNYFVLSEGSESQN